METCLKLLSRNCWNCAPNDFFKLFCICELSSNQYVFCYLGYLYDSSHNLFCKISQQWADFTTTHSVTNPVTKLYCQNKDWSFCATVNVCGCTHSSILAVFTDYFDTPISWDKRFKDSCRHGYEHIPLLSHVSAGRTPNDHSSIFFKVESLFIDLFISCYIVDLQGTERTRNWLTNLLWYILIGFLLHLVFHSRKYQLLWLFMIKIVGSIAMKSPFVACTYIFNPQTEFTSYT
jgi:hypothetical protein